MLKSIKQITSDTTLQMGYDVYNINASNGSITITLPPIDAHGQNLNIKRIDTNSSNTVTIQGSNGQTIDSSSSITLAANGSIQPIASGPKWYTMSGIGNNIAGPKNELSIRFMSTTVPIVPYFLIGTTSYIKIQNFIYQGSLFYGRAPVKLTISYSLNTGASDTDFTVKVVDITNSTQICSITATATTNVNTVLLSSTSTFTNIPTADAVIEIQAKLANNGINVRLYSLYLQFS